MIISYQLTISAITYATYGTFHIHPFHSVIEKIIGVNVMSGNVGLYFFTEERLMEFAANIHNESVLSTTRKMNEMTSPQQVRAMRNNGASLRRDEKTLKNVVDANVKPCS
ncbi:hypothetical protein [Endozoicomonas sp. ONNA2]|uniref:hypothetical protein n=1 Tax=Endozoicomonas sp. ONNA2 TaxID=2828741 RepID=UPI0021480A94|nr:hypothetical protein [Endozoicomonas sp. ONNA2]